MPQVSEHQRLLCDLEEAMKYHAMLSLVESAFDDVPYRFKDGEHVDLWNVFAAYHCCISNNRYLSNRHHIPKSKDFAENIFLDLPPDQFRQITRLNRPTFDNLLRLIEDHPIFHNESPNPQAPICAQLACALDRLGNDGQGVSHGKLGHFWGIAHGTTHLYTSRVLTAICSLQHQFIQWPNAASRRWISERMALKGFKGAVAFIDGTTIPLHKKPGKDGNLYMDQKSRYSVNAQVVCDDRRQILYFFTGYPGSVGDSIVFTESELGQHLEEALSPREYIIADSAYALTKCVVVPYKENQIDDPQDRNERKDIDDFNTYLAKARVCNEHTIEILKARWSSLRGMRVDINEGFHMKIFVKQTLACCILHNFCIGKDKWDEPETSRYVDADDVGHDSGGGSQRGFTAGQLKRREVRRACLAFHEASHS